MLLKNFRIIPPDPPNEGIIFVDHSKRGRSGHLGHALVEYQDGKILAFYPNCSGDNREGHFAGHSGAGWMEYKRSEDGGYTWSEPHILDYSKKMFESGTGRSAMCEKAIAASDGTIILFNLICDISKFPGWEPHLNPTYICSRNGGLTWSEAKDLSDKKGRVYDAIYHENTIFALHFHNPVWLGKGGEDKYLLHVSTDNGETFSTRSILPFDTCGRAYGTMEILGDGSLIAYVYNIKDESRLDYVISKDLGHTWSEVKTTRLEKRIRNPQMARLGDSYFLHGRSGNSRDYPMRGNLVLYSSQDGINWDRGIYLRMKEAGIGAYSNNLVTGRFGSEKREERLLIQSSHAYKQSRTNILHWWIEKKSS
ncbi:MAG TPA: sialidase family protein [bacterium]|nr:sialidase family protein [bacterium]